MQLADRSGDHIFNVPVMNICSGFETEAWRRIFRPEWEGTGGEVTRE
jgi:hypothetical protein